MEFLPGTLACAVQVMAAVTCSELSDDENAVPADDDFFGFHCA